MAFSKFQLFAPDGTSLSPVKPVQHGRGKVWSIYKGDQLVWRVCKVRFVDWDGTEIKEEEVVLGHSATPPPDPTRPGYAFDGWYPQYANIQANTTISAQYHHSFHLDLKALPPSGGSVDGAGYYEPSERVEVKATAAGGYNFLYWSDGGAKTHTVVMDSDKSLTAYFGQSQLLMVYFRDWDGRLLKSQAVAYGADAVPPLNPTRTGYRFDHWEGTWTHVTSDQDVLAAYTPNQYVVSFNPGEGTVYPTEKVVTFGAIYGELPTPEHTQVPHQQFGFDGWNTQSSGEGRYIDAVNVVDIPANHTLYAIWDEMRYCNIRFIDWDGTVLLETACAYGEDLPASEFPPDPTRTGYQFDHWEGTWTHVTSDQDVLAAYTPNQYTVTFDMQNGIGGTQSTIATYGSPMPPITIPTRGAMVFGGYYDGPSGSGNKYYDSVGESARSWDKVSDATLSANWTVPASGEASGFNGYPLTYNAIFSFSFGGAGVNPEDPATSSKLKTIDPDAKQYLQSMYSPNGEWRNIDIGGNGVDHLVFTGIPGHKYYKITMDIKIDDFDSSHAADTNSDAEIRLFFVDQRQEYTSGVTQNGYIDGSAPTKLVYMRAGTGAYPPETYGTSSFDLMSKYTRPSLAQAKASAQTVTLTVDARNATKGQFLADVLDAWIYIDTGTNSYIRASCTNCKISWSDQPIQT